MISPIWAGVFFVIGGIITTAIGLVAWQFGFSASDDRVFAIEALAGGLLTIQAMQKFFDKRFVVAPKVTIPFFYIWILLSLYVFIFKPLE